MDFYLVLLQAGVCNALNVTTQAVSSYLTFSPLPINGGIFSVALSVSSRLPGVTWRPALRSPDFPLNKFSDHPTNSDAIISIFYFSISFL